MPIRSEGPLDHLTLGLIAAQEASQLRGASRKTKIDEAKAHLSFVRENPAWREGLQLVTKLDYAIKVLEKGSEVSNPKLLKVSLAFYRRFIAKESAIKGFEILDKGPADIRRLERALDQCVQAYVEKGSKADFSTFEKELDAHSAWKNLDQTKFPAPLKMALKPLLFRYQLLVDTFEDLKETKAQEGRIPAEGKLRLEKFEYNLLKERDIGVLKSVAGSEGLEELLEFKEKGLKSLPAEEKEAELVKFGTLRAIQGLRGENAKALTGFSVREMGLITKEQRRKEADLWSLDFDTVQNKEKFILNLPLKNWPADEKKALLRQFIPEPPDISRKIDPYLTCWTALFRAGFVPERLETPLEGLSQLRNADLRAKIEFKNAYQKLINDEGGEKKVTLQDELDRRFPPESLQEKRKL